MSRPPLIKAWRGVGAGKRPYVLDGDRPALEFILNAEDGYHRFRNYKQYSQSNLCQDLSDKTKFHFNLLPVPYWGKIMKAKVYILALNPGFGFDDYYAESKSAYRQHQINQLRQQNLDRRFPWINPEFCCFGGFEYWFGRMKPVIENLQHKNGWDLRKTLSFVSKRVATLELIPYHSESYGLSRKIYNRMESPKLMLDFVHDYVVPKAKKGEALVVCARKVKDWKMEKPMRNVIAFKGAQTRGAYLSGCTDRIVKMMET